MTDRLKLVLIGAGSTVFTQRLVADLILSGEFHRWELALVDIDPITIKAVDALVRKMLCYKNAEFPIVSTTDRREVLRGARFRRHHHRRRGPARLGDRHPNPAQAWDLPAGRRLRNAGGISRAMRMIPQMVAIAEDIDELCPDAHFFNYGNPMTAICRAIRLKTGVPVVGLCHGVTYVEGLLARFLGCDASSISSSGVGLNHMTFLTDIRVNGEDAKPLIRAKIDQQRPLAEKEIREKTEWPNGVSGRAIRYSDDPLSWSIFDRYGVFPVAMDRHVSEFFPERFPGGRYFGRTLGVDAFSIDGRIALGDTWFDEMLAVARSADPLPPSYFDNVPGESEQLVAIIYSILEDRRKVFSANLPAGGTVPDMPRDAVLELPATAGGSGFAALQSQALPPALAAKVLSKIAAVEVTVQAALTGSFELFVEALLTDGSVTEPAKAVSLARDLLEAHKVHLPQFAST